MIKTCEELNQARVQAQLEIQSYACRILVCSGTGCIATGSHKIHERFEDLVKETPGIELVFSPCGGHDGETVVGVKKTGCQGFCELGPLVRIQKGDKVIQYVKVQPGDCAEIVEKSVKDCFEPHFAVIRGDHTAALTALAQLLSLDVCAY